MPKVQRCTQGAVRRLCTPYLSTSQRRKSGSAFGVGGSLASKQHRPAVLRTAHMLLLQKLRWATDGCRLLDTAVLTCQCHVVPVFLPLHIPQLSNLFPRSAPVMSCACAAPSFLLSCTLWFSSLHSATHRGSLCGVMAVPTTEVWHKCEACAFGTHSTAAIMKHIAVRR